jgi:hypothetical protein
LQTAREILIIDPFLDWRDVPPASRYRETLSAIVQSLHGLGARNVTVQLHFRTHDARPPVNLVVANARRFLNGLLPQTFSLELYEWAERANGEDFHDRHIICDCGGLSIGAGFEAVGGHQHAEVSLKPFGMTQALKARFTVGTAAFDLVGKVFVIAHDGTACERTTR